MMGRLFDFSLIFFFKENVPNFCSQIVFIFEIRTLQTQKLTLIFNDFTEKKIKYFDKNCGHGIYGHIVSSEKKM